MDERGRKGPGGEEHHSHQGWWLVKKGGKGA